MPVIRPERLKQQAADLAQSFSDPDRFLRLLDTLLNIYAERAIRPGIAGESLALLEKYAVPPPVLRYILLALGPYAQQEPASALQLCDHLWQEPNLEFRTLAIGLLGLIPVTETNQVLFRAKMWVQQESDRRLVSSIFAQSLAPVRKNNPELIVALAQEWLQEPGMDKQRLGLQALLPLASDPGFENLPVFFKILIPIAVQIKTDLRPELLDIVLALARRSPRETTYFVQELLQIPGCLSAGWLARQLLPHLPEDIAPSLRQALHAVSSQPTRPITPGN